MKLEGKKTSHAPRSQQGTGDYYGRGIKAKIGKLRSSPIYPPNPKNQRSKKFETPVV